jgi:APA family basic amino acid/polyamine antiporter
MKRVVAVSSKFNQSTAIAIVVANMIGTGVFTSLGFQLIDIQSVFVLMMLWLVGGITALCGALTYAELGANLPRSGGEYNFLGRIYHPAMGFVSGWISVSVGFAAPIALAAMTFGAYLSSAVSWIDSSLAAALLILCLACLHCYSRRASGQTQLVFTTIKVLLILAFCLLVFFFSQSRQPISLLPAIGDATILTSGAFAVALIYVNYAYTGWNAATYILDEMDGPQKKLPLVLLAGTIVVIIFYLMLNYVFLLVAPMEAMSGKIEVGLIASEYAFGQQGGKLMGLMLSVLLISTVSAMLMAGPRVLQVIGQDFQIFRFLSFTNQAGLPIAAIVCVALLAEILVLTATFESVLVFSGFVLAVNTLFTVAGVFVMRAKGMAKPGAYRTFGYPVTPLIFLILTLWTLIYILINRPQEGFSGLLIIAVGLVLYWLSNRYSQQQQQ